MSIRLLKYGSLAISLGMLALVIWTSMQSNMFKLPQPVLREPWFWTTIVDFYNNIAIICLWVVYKENHAVKSLFWIIAFITLGSVATMFYVFLQFAALKEGDGIEAVLLRRK